MPHNRKIKSNFNQRIKSIIASKLMFAAKIFFEIIKVKVIELGFVGKYPEVTCCSCSNKSIPIVIISVAHFVYCLQVVRLTQADIQ